MRNHRGNVENQNHGAVTKNRSAADERGGDKAIFERFDDELLFSHEAIDDQAEFTIACAYDDHEDAFRALGFGLRLEAFEADERENLLTQLKDFVFVDAVDFIVGNPGDLNHGSDGNSVEPASDAKQKRLDAGES
jgi:hypothetical protein